MFEIYLISLCPNKIISLSLTPRGLTLMYRLRFLKSKSCVIHDITLVSVNKK